MNKPKSIENYKPKNKRIIELKPNFDDAANRWEAYWNHDLIDRPILIATIGKPDAAYKEGTDYRSRINGNVEDFLQNAMHNASCIEWLGESMPSFWTSLGTHEFATFCGYEVEWAPDGSDTNWCKHSDRPLEELLPLRIDTEGHMWKRTLEMYRKSAEVFDGRVIPFSFDSHTNLDLLLSVRGDANLCMDTVDCPEVVDKGIENSCVLFKQLWNEFVKLSNCDEYGYFYGVYSEKPTISLACDFSALIGPDMFKRWGVAALEYESSVIGDRTIYHWDGPAALKHKDDLISIKNLHTFSYVPSPYTYHHQFLELYKECQDRGKGICYGGTIEEIKAAHKILKPNMTIYSTAVESVDEFNKLSEWFKKNT